MKAIISTTSDDNYLFFLPIVNYCWRQLGVETICFSPKKIGQKEWFVISQCRGCWHIGFDCKPDAEATYAQVSRLFAAALPDLDKTERLITSDADMLVFGDKLLNYHKGIILFGTDLLEGMEQYPMCYISMTVENWIEVMSIKGSYQECLDRMLGNEIANKDMRGNLWARDQELAYNMIRQSNLPKTFIARAPTRFGQKHGQYFAENRVDRDDINWRSYLGQNLIDAHLWRPGYTDQNFANIMELLTTQYPTDSFEWLIKYRNAYISLL